VESSSATSWRMPQIPRRLRRPRTLVALVLALAVVIVGVRLGPPYLGEVVDRYAERGPVATLVDVRDVAQVQQAFTDASGIPRLVLLLSPT
jgi:hypothetical protein